MASAVQAIRKSGLLHTFTMVNWERMAGEAFRQNDYPTQVSGVFGAENAPAQSFNMEIDKVRLLDLFASYHNL
jgi:hypothetical protein